MPPIQTAYFSANAKKDTDTWLQLTISRNSFNQGGKVIANITVQYAKNDDGAWNVYVPVAADWKQVGNGTYQLRIGAAEFTVVGHYVIRVSWSGVGLIFDDTFLFVEVMDYLPGEVRLDELIDATAGGVDPTVGSIMDQVMNKNGAQTFAQATDSLEAISDGGGGGITQQQVRDAMKLAPAIGAPAAGSVDQELDDILADTAAMQPLIDVATSTRAAPGDAMDLTPGAVDDIWDEDVVAAHGGADSSGLLLRALGALISQRANNATLNALLGINDAAANDLPAQIDTELTAAHGAGLWNAAGGGDWTVAERNQMRFRLAMDGLQANPVTNDGTIEDILDTVIDTADTVDDLQVTLDAVAVQVNDIHGIETGRWQITNNQMLFYDLANNVIFRYNLFNKAGQPSETDIHERRPV